jgi:hypothetical protein
MSSTEDPKSTKDVLVARADEQLSHVHEQLARADEQLARVSEQLAKMEREGTAAPSSESAPQPSRRRPARRRLIAVCLVSAACIFGILVAAFGWHSFRSGLRLTITRWAPRLVSTSSLPPEKPRLAAQPDPPSVQMAAADGVAAQAPLLAESAPHDAAPTGTTAAPAAAAAPPAGAGTNPELTQSLQTMARDLTKLQQSIAELKAKQDQMASDYAKAIEQLKAKQEEMTRRLANVSAQNAAPRPPPPRPAPPRRARERERPLTPPPVYWDYYDEPW